MKRLQGIVDVVARPSYLIFAVRQAACLLMVLRFVVDGRAVCELIGMMGIK